MIVGKFDLELSIEDALTMCMVKAFLISIDMANNTIMVRLSGGKNVYAVILFTCQHWLHSVNITRFDNELASKYGYTTIPYGEPINLLKITRNKIDEYYYTGPNTTAGKPMHMSVPLCWPFLPFNEYIVISLSNDFSYNRHHHYPYIDKNDQFLDPYALITPTFITSENTTKSCGANDPPTTSTENPGRVLRITGTAPNRNFVNHQPYEMWSNERVLEGFYFPPPVIYELPGSSDFLNKSIGITIDSEYANGSIINITLDRILYAQSGWNYIPEKLILKAELSNDYSGVYSCLHVMGNGNGLRHKTNGVYDDYIIAIQVYSSTLGPHSIDLNAATQIGWTRYAGGWGSSLITNEKLLYSPIKDARKFGNVCSSSLFCALDADLYQVNSYILISVYLPYEVANAWIYSELSDDIKDAKVTATVNVTAMGCDLTNESTTRGVDDFRAKLSNIELQIPYWVSDLYEFKYREDLDDTKGVLVYQDDSNGHLMMFPYGYFTHTATLDNENGTTHNYTDDWVVDQALIYKWNNQEICREVRSGTSSASGTHTTGATWQDWVSGSGTLTQSITIKEIIWDTIVPKLGFFTFWECEFFTNDKWGGSDSTITYKLYAWDNGSKTLLKTETKTMTADAHDKLLHPHYYMQRKNNPLGHDNHVGDFNGVSTRTGCGIPRFQIKQWGSYPEIYYSAKEQIPQSILDEWKDCEYNNMWHITGAIPSVSMMSFFEHDFVHGIDYGIFFGLPEGVVAQYGNNHSIGIIGNMGSSMAESTFQGGAFGYPDTYPDTVGASPIVAGIKTTDKYRFNFGIGLFNINVGLLLGSVYYHYGYDTEYYGGNAVELANIKNALGRAIDNPSSNGLRFWG